MALAKNPKDLTALVNRGVVFFEMGQDHYSDALNALTQARRDGAIDRRVFYYLGVLYEDLSVFDEAEKQYARFLNNEPGDREIRLRLARLLFRMGKWDSAIEHYHMLLEQNPKDVTTLVNLGLAHQLRYKAEAAVSGKNKMSPSDLNGLLEQGIKHLEAARVLDPNLSKGVFLALAQMYAAQNKWEESASAAKSELEKYPGENVKDSYQSLSAAYEKLKQNENLLHALEAWAAADPKNSTLPRKIKSLKKLLKIK